MVFQNATYSSLLEDDSQGERFFMALPLVGQLGCDLKKCCKAYKKKGRHCKKCPKKD
jgi:hypothetical protein